MFRTLFTNLGVLLTLGSQVAADPTRLSATPFVENVFKNSEISGTLIVGLSRMTSSLSEDLRISAEVPAHWDTLCLSVTTIDGLYEARNEFDLPEDWLGGEVIFDYPTAHRSLLLQAGSDSIGTLVQKGPCTAQGEQLALSGWRLLESSPDSFRLFVNAFQADEVVAYVGNGPETRCTSLAGTGRAAYDIVCDLRLNEESESPTEIELIRVRSGRVEASTSVILEW